MHREVAWGAESLTLGALGKRESLTEADYGDYGDNADWGYPRGQPHARDYALLGT